MSARTLLLLALAGTPLSAQHIPPMTGISVNGECQACHRLHPAGPTTAGLITTTTGGIRSWLQVQAPGSGDVSLSCLRCHTTPGERGRQAEFVGSPPMTADSGYLGADLGDDHILGTVLSTSAVRTRVDLSDPRRLQSNRQPLLPVAPIECTTCHDPHERPDIIREAVQQRVVCGSCHDPSQFELLEHGDHACSSCHAVHGGSRGALLRAPTAEGVCAACHTGKPRTIGNALTDRFDLVAAPTPRAGPEHDGRRDCMSCHKIHQP